ncbi:MAG: acyl carrier protein [Gemmataceae bacterium]
MTESDIFEKVQATLVDALNADEDQVTPTARLQADLGAESIDFLDIVFRLEREFNIKIPRGELFPESIFQGDSSLVQNGKVTEVGLQELREKMPFADAASLDLFAMNPEMDKLGDLFTVNLIVRYIHNKVAK